jgi:hypothetical protein
MRITIVNILFWATFTANAQSSGNLIFQWDLIDRLDRIEDALTGNLNSPATTYPPRYIQIGSSDASRLEIDDANTIQQYPAIHITIFRIIRNADAVNKQGKKYRSIKMYAVVNCDTDKQIAGLTPSTIVWEDANKRVVASYSGLIQKIKRSEMSGHFNSIYTHICEKRHR